MTEKIWKKANVPRVVLFVMKKIMKQKFLLAMQLSTFNIFISDVRICEKFEFGRIWNCSVAFIAATVRRKSESCDFLCVRAVFFLSPGWKRPNRRNNVCETNSPKKYTAEIITFRPKTSYTLVWSNEMARCTCAEIHWRISNYQSQKPQQHSHNYNWEVSIIIRFDSFSQHRQKEARKKLNHR